eukprot:XP_764357.1 hypothetical protein [Theileria parva strain Muguga]
MMHFGSSYQTNQTPKHRFRSLNHIFSALKFPSSLQVVYNYYRRMRVRSRGSVPIYLVMQSVRKVVPSVV